MPNNQLHLGLGPSPRPQFLYVSTEHSPTGWHLWNHATAEAIIVEEPALTGYVRAVEVVERERRGEIKQKLNLHVACGPRRYIVEAGLTTQFARSILSALARLQPEHFAYPLTVAVERGSDEKVVFGNLYNATNGGEIKGAADARERDPADLARAVQANLVAGSQAA
jgi:hypothetical protein